MNSLFIFEVPFGSLDLHDNPIILQNNKWDCIAKGVGRVTRKGIHIPTIRFLDNDFIVYVLTSLCIAKASEMEATMLQQGPLRRL